MGASSMILRDPASQMSSGNVKETVEGEGTERLAWVTSRTAFAADRDLELAASSGLPALDERVSGRQHRSALHPGSAWRGCSRGDALSLSRPERSLERAVRIRNGLKYLS